MPPCKGTKQDGTPCRYSAPTDSPYCRNHDPNVTPEQRKETAARAGRASGQARQPYPLQNLNLDFSTPTGIQAAIEIITRLELLGRINPARSRNILRALTLAQRNFDKTQSYPGTTERKHHPSREYNQTRNQLIATINHILKEEPETPAPSVQSQAPQQPSSPPATSPPANFLQFLIDHQK